MNSEIEKKLKICGEVEVGQMMSELTTLRVGGPVDYVIYPHNNFNLINTIELLKKNRIPYKVLGNGSNILASDQPFHGVIIKPTRFFDDFAIDDDVMLAQSGCSIIALAYQAMTCGLSGLEFASGIPGTAGGCLYMNAGAYKSSMSDIVEAVQVLADDQIFWLNKRECHFGYRSSVFQKHADWTILSVKLQLKRLDSDKIRNLMEQRQAKRMATQPLDMPSAGSVFRNPQGHFAWEFIDEIGYRGRQIGDAAVSCKHPNFIVNAGHAKSCQIAQLIDEIQTQVKEKHNIELVREVEMFNWPLK